MNSHRRTYSLLAVAIALAGSMNSAMAAEDIRWTWDSSLGSWGTAWGQAATTWDASQDNTGNGGGSIHVSSDFAGNPGEYPNNVITVMGNHGGWLWNGDVRTNLLEYASLELDIKWDNASTLALTNFNASGGDSGLRVVSARYVPGVEPDPWNWGVTLGTILIPEAAANGWVHISIPIDPTTPNLDDSAGIVFMKWVPDETTSAGGVASFWIDNVELIASQVPIDPPTLSVSTDVQAGLNLITLAGSQWQRQGIRTAAENYSWVGSSTPTTYEFTVGAMPATDYAGMHTHIFLAPNDPRTRTDVDWGLADIIRFEMSLQPDGSGLATLRYKTDAPDGNGGMYGGEGELGSVSNPTVLGKWGFTFNDATSVTVFSPSMTTNLIFPAAETANFDAPVTVYFGCMPNAPERVGQKAVLTQAAIRGAVGGEDLIDDFTGPLNTEMWEMAAEFANGVVVLTDDAACWVQWTLPDTGFNLQAAAAVGTADWVPYAGATAPLSTGTTKSVLVNKSGLPGDQQSYWRLKQREFTKLQILLPGETAAPGTATGKTGTPAQQILYADFNVIINAVSDDWTVIRNVNDVVTFSSTDQDILAEDVTLVNGTATAVVNMGTLGTQTVTVSDVTNPAIQSDTSSEFTIIPL